MTNKRRNKNINKTQKGKIIRVGMQVVGSAIPFAGGLFSAAAGAWSEKEQEKVNSFLKHWIEMLKDEIKEKEHTILEIIARLDIHDEEISKRVSSDQYQSLLKKAFREWSCAESEEKRVLVRNVLSNAAATDIASDDLIRLFLDWLNVYSEMHFQVIGVVYNSNGISRGEIWRKIGRGEVREDSADADLFKLLIRDLSTGGVIRQHRETDYTGNYILKKPSRVKGSQSRNTAKSAFDHEDKYELTQLGQQFVHYAMTDLPLKIEYRPDQNTEGRKTEASENRR